MHDGLIEESNYDRATQNLNEATNEFTFRRFSLHNHPEKQFTGITQIVGETISLDAAQRFAAARNNTRNTYAGIGLFDVFISH